MKRISLFLVFFSACVFAQSLEEIYIKGGVSAIKERIETNLRSYEYWRKEFENKDLKYGYYSSNKMLITVGKQQKNMKVFEYNDGVLTPKFSQAVLVGKEGDKNVEGDLKTPVGVYDITSRFIPKNRYYGPLAFVLSYPNLLDKLAKKNGGGIWIHGFPMDGERDNNYRTRGCVAVENDLLVEFGKIINDKGIVMIGEDDHINANNEDISTVMASLFEWKNVWEKNDINAYLDFYADDFTRFDGMSIDKFKEMKRRIFAKNEPKEIRFSDISITPYPNVKNLNIFRVVFYEDYNAPSYKFKGYKELYVRLDRGKFKIIIED